MLWRHTESILESPSRSERELQAQSKTSEWLHRFKDTATSPERSGLARSYLPAEDTGDKVPSSVPQRFYKIVNRQIPDQWSDFTRLHYPILLKIFV